MTCAVVVNDLAIGDVIELEDWIAERSDRETATEYGSRIWSRVATLEEFSDRGTPRQDLAPGTRSLSFERRLVIFYRVHADSVEVLRIMSGLRDLRQFDV